MNELKQNTSLQGGKYQIICVLGQGGFGITYLARHTMLQKDVAVKEFFFKEFCEREEDTTDMKVATKSRVDFVERFRKKFIKEVRMISEFNHPNIVRIFDVFDENGTSYYSMEYVRGESVSSMVRRWGRLPEDTALEIIRAVASALEYIHSRNINHLDIKPGNILIEEDTKRPVLIDFGISKQYDANTGEGTTTTPVGVSAGYSPIEQYREGGVASFSPESDVYSLGATLYKMLTGETPPVAMDLVQSEIDIPAYISPNVRKAIKRAMTAKKSARPSSVREFMAILDEEAEDDGDATKTAFTEEKTSVYEGAGNSAKQDEESTVKFGNEAPGFVWSGGSGSESLGSLLNSNGGKSKKGKGAKIAIIAVVAVFLLIIIAVIASPSGNEEPNWADSDTLVEESAVVETVEAVEAVPVVEVAPAADTFVEEAAAEAAAPAYEDEYPAK